ncbi:hypothetical protein ACFQ9Z_35310 [Streptomyces sp. NPDC056580]|uniref:hypothetical protein n=1 Tax=Streptomyces sp. NPDC056580 TaxID=3345872 RepID=UPI00369149E6
MDRGRAGRQPALIAGVLEVTGGSGPALWPRGGRAMDLFLGEVTRDHGDADRFPWARDAADLTRTPNRLGHRPVPGPPAGLRLVTRDGPSSSFTRLDPA